MKKTSKVRKSLSAASAGVLAFALSASAGVRTLLTPPPSEFVDAESSVNVSLPTTEGRHIRLKLAFEPSPTNAVQVAFGRDDDGDGDLAPEETVVRVGCDCGVPFAREEVAVASRRPTVEWSNLHSTTTTTNYNYELHQPKAVAARWDLAKVTTHNVDGTNVAVTAKFYSTGFALILR